MILAFELVDLGAFVALGLSVALAGAMVLGLARWLRSRAADGDRGDYPGL